MIKKETLIKWKSQQILEKVKPQDDNSRISRDTANELIQAYAADEQSGSRLRGKLAEQFFFEITGGLFSDCPGFDGFIKGKKYEIKYTDWVQNKHAFRIQNCTSRKQGKFDRLIIIEGLSGRVFSIPHDVWFAKAKFRSGEFHWFKYYEDWSSNVRATYNSPRPDNTQLLMDHPITKDSNLGISEFGTKAFYEKVFTYMYSTVAVQKA